MARAQCYYDGKAYSSGSFVCQEDILMVCEDGEWIKRGTGCAKRHEEKKEPKVSAERPTET
jgi:hypothetical protein